MKKIFKDFSVKLSTGKVVNIYKVIKDKKEIKKLTNFSKGGGHNE